MGRRPDHVVQYALAEMGTTGSLDGEQQFVIKGRFGKRKRKKKKEKGKQKQKQNKTKQKQKQNKTKQNKTKIILWEYFVMLGKRK